MWHPINNLTLPGSTIGKATTFKRHHDAIGSVVEPILRAVPNPSTLRPN